MKVEYDEDADAMYIELRDGEFSHNKVVDNLTILDYDKEGNLLGIELLEVSRRFPEKVLSDISLKKVAEAHP
ncbi:DUF2283 domain-containing protein [Candidatus Woesearchaeota archaeon]|nr:DUF2283 domain-containing protein [Candidatus Woesearchaeota archaeon]